MPQAVPGGVNTIGIPTQRFGLSGNSLRSSIGRGWGLIKAIIDKGHAPLVFLKATMLQNECLLQSPGSVSSFDNWLLGIQYIEKTYEH
jgi:hypothetical protein